jgi:AraC-like DNA-binding protein
MMLYDPEGVVFSGDMPFSAYLALSRAQRSTEGVKTALFGDNMNSVPGQFFEPLSGVHFGMCGPVAVPAIIRCDFYCDIPALMCVVVLDGESSYTFKDVPSSTITLRKNMFMVGNWEEMYGTGVTPSQESYCHVAVSIEKGAVARHFGQKAEEEMREILARSLGLSRSVCGPASPDALILAKQILHMHKQGPLATMALRGAVVDFFTCLLKNATEQDLGPVMPLHERDTLVLTTLKERMEKNCAGLMAKELCASISMSESKANKGFKALFGTTIAKHLHACKMAHAHTLLARKKLTVNECAFSLGYSNVGHFIAAFRKYYGLTPKDAARKS